MLEKLNCWDGIVEIPRMQALVVKTTDVKPFDDPRGRPHDEFLFPTCPDKGYQWCLRIRINQGSSWIVAMVRNVHFWNKNHAPEANWICFIREDCIKLRLFPQEYFYSFLPPMIKNKHEKYSACNHITVSHGFSSLLNSLQHQQLLAYMLEAPGAGCSVKLYQQTTLLAFVCHWIMKGVRNE